LIYRLVIFSLLGLSCFADPINMWVDDASGNIAQVNVATGAVTPVGNAGVVLTDIAFAPNGNLYGISFSELYTVNTSTGNATAVGSLGVSDANALVFSSTGVLYTATLSGSFYTVNTSTGAASDVGSLGGGYGSGGDLAFVGGKLYLATSSSDLVTVNPSTGAASLVGSFGVPNVFGLATPDNSTLYAAAGQNLYTVNLSDGAATFDTTWAGNSQGFGSANGEAFITESGGGPTVTPEPATVALFGTALGLLGLRLRLRSRIPKHA
jgi:hypothetical protein